MPEFKAGILSQNFGGRNLGPEFSLRIFGPEFWAGILGRNFGLAFGAGIKAGILGKIFGPEFVAGIFVQNFGP